jgi:hypothetical protein
MCPTRPQCPNCGSEGIQNVDEQGIVSLELTPRSGRFWTRDSSGVGEKQGAVLFKGAIKHLTVLVDHLAELAPKRQNEPELPTLEEVPVLPVMPKNS